MLILCDVDGVLAYLDRHWLSTYRDLTGDMIYPEDIDVWDFIPLLKYPEVVWEILDAPDFYEGVQPMRGAVRGIKTLRKMGHRVVFVTASTPNGARGKMLWLQRYGLLPEGITPRSFKDFISANDKSLVHGDAMIDDGVHNLKTFQGLRILFDAPYNQEYIWCTRVKTWKEIVHFFRNEIPPRRWHGFNPIEGV